MQTATGLAGNLSAQKSQNHLRCILMQVFLPRAKLNAHDPKCLTAATAHSNMVGAVGARRHPIIWIPDLLPQLLLLAGPKSMHRPLEIQPGLCRVREVYAHRNATIFLPRKDQLAITKSSQQRWHLNRQLQQQLLH